MLSKLLGEVESGSEENVKSEREKERTRVSVWVVQKQNFFQKGL